MPKSKVGPYLTLHLLVFIFGFTGIMGRYIDTPSTAITVYRTGITFIVLFLYVWIKGYTIFPGWKKLILMVLSGGVIGLHWVAFFEAIKTANVTVTMAMLATGALFTSFLEPIFFHRRLRIHEVLLGLIVIGGVYIIRDSVDGNDAMESGVVIALIASFLSACYSIINGKWSAAMPNDTVMVIMWEMIGAVVVVTTLFSFIDGFWAGFTQVDMKDAILIFTLAIGCTAFTNVKMIQLFRYLTPFTVTLNINMEPIYSMVMAVILFADERMSTHFYAGAAVILLTVVLNAVLNNIREKRESKKLLSHK